MALAGGHKPKIFHSDQDYQFNSTALVGRLKAEQIEISWSGRRRCYGISQLKRLWSTFKYAAVYLRAYSDDWEAEISLARFLWRYCHVIPAPMRSALRANPVPPPQG
jgi:putative transposase